MSLSADWRMLREDKEMRTIFLSLQFFCNIRILPNKVLYVNKVTATHYGRPVAPHACGAESPL